MKKIVIIVAALFAYASYQSPLAAQEQEDVKGHELSVAIQGLGIGSMPFHGEVSWDDQPGLSLGFNVGYTYWFGEHFGFHTGLRLTSFSHNQKLTNFNETLNASLKQSSLGLPGGSAMTTVNLRGEATSIQEEQQYTYLELPLQLAVRYGDLFANVGVSLSKAVSASADYSFTDPKLFITGIPDNGIYPNPAVPLAQTGATEKSVKNVAMTKPFYFLLGAEVGYKFPLGEATDLAVGLYGRVAPFSHKTGNEPDFYVLNTSDATFSVIQPSTSAQVARTGYYEIGLMLGVNFGMNKKQKSADEEAQLAPVDNRYDAMASELAALKAAREKSDAELAAMKAAREKSDAELAAMKAAQKKAEEELSAMKAAQAKAASEQAAASRQQQAQQQTQQQAQPAKQETPKAQAQRKLDAVGATIYFDFKSTSVKPAAAEEEALQAICEAMKANPEMQVVITGHTDDRGSAKTNWKYGYRRARALKLYMTKLGAPAANIKCESKGEKEPIADNQTDEGRAKNRRATVELK